MLNTPAHKNKLASEEIVQALGTLPGWVLNQDSKLEKTYTLGSFAQAISLINALAPHADELDHHPELFNVYNTVRIELVTHDADGITPDDVELARRIDLEATAL